MQTAQRIIKNYRRNRLIVCTLCALLTLILTLTVRFISERNLNHRNTVTFANHAVEELDDVLLPLQTGRDVLLPLIGLPCSVARLPLSKHAARLQTVRSISLIQSGSFIVPAFLAIAMCLFANWSLNYPVGSRNCCCLPTIR